MESVTVGKWIRLPKTEYMLSVDWRCSVCGTEYTVAGIMTPFGLGYRECPNCKAKIDGCLQ